MEPNRAALALSLHALGSVLFETGDLETSRTLYERAVEIWKVALGADHPQYAVGLSGLASVLARTGRWRESKDLFDRALSIQEKALGSDHPDVAQNLVRLGEVLAHERETDRALACFLRAEEIGRGHLRLVVTALSEREALRYASVRPSGLDPALSLAASGRLPDPPSEVFDMVIRSRVLVLDEMASRRHIAAAAGGERARGPLEALTRASRRLASLKIRGPEGQTADQYFRSISLAQKEMEDAERGLARESAAFRRNLVKVQAGVREVAAALPSRSALVGYVLYRDGVSDAASPTYLALVLRSGAKAPVLVRLGKAATIDDLVAGWRGRIAGWRPGGPLPAREADPAAREAGELLRRRVWDPLAALLRGTARVFIVPDGALHFVDFSALPIREASYVLDEDPLIHYLSSERDLLRQPSQEGRGWGLLALGGPDFDLSRLAVLPSLAGRRGEVSKGSGWFRDPASGCSDWRSLRFTALPAAGQEIEEIATLWSHSASSRPDSGSSRPSPSPGPAPAVIRLSGPDATEAAFKRDAGGRRALHLATHGFFLDALCRQASFGSRGIGGLVPAPSPESAARAFENPLLLAGLALAGANNRSEAGPDEEDGILTGEEIAAMDLSGVEWAVLSACDTGIGKVTAGEGVLGLRRAFQIAGVATVITSLWPVDDSAARDWMRELYRARHVEGRSTSEAVREAGRRLLRRQREGAGTTNPIYWAGFLASGDWR